jgi:hypothetical protein
MFGFELTESITGTWHSFEEPLVDRRVRVKMKLTVNGLRRFTLERQIKVEGRIHAEGLAEDRPLTGSIKWRLLDEQRVFYELELDGDDGREYHIRGQRDFFLYNAIGSLTTMFASVYDEDDREIGRAVLHFEPKLELPALLKTFRPRLFLR